MFDSNGHDPIDLFEGCSRDRNKRTAPCRLFSGTPMARRTCGSIEQEPRADPSEAAMPARLRWWRIASPSRSSKAIFVQTPVPDIIKEGTELSLDRLSLQ
ncbi:hypothetical protein ACVWYH_002192 [Bradyrhizobium sp. GM24.11]